MRRNQGNRPVPLWRRAGLALAVVSAACAASALGALAQTSPGPSRPLVTQPIDEGQRVVLAGNTRPEARRAGNDRGIVPEAMPMPHMQLQLRRPAAQEQALAALIDQLHDAGSPNYHRWLGAAEFGARFGPAASDVAAVTGWLRQQGFVVNTLYASGMAIDFSGTAGQVRTAFGTEIHALDVNGAARFANVSDPQIPAALAPVVVGVVSLHDIPPKPTHRRRAQHGTGASPDYTISDCQLNIYIEGSDCYAVTPADLATIYNFKPVFGAGNTGQNQTIYLIEDSDLFGGTSGGTNADWVTFRSTFGLSGTGATISTIHPGNNCSDPGTNQDDGEAILDAEWASAAAPSAAIVVVACADATTSGLLIALQNLINGANAPAIVSVSYGECEVKNGAAANAAYAAIYQQGVAAGASIFVSTGDSAADVCDRGDQDAYSGVGVNGFGSTPYNVAVGGTDFSALSSGTTGTYWSASNTPTYGSAKSYIPEMPWNGTCGSLLIAAFYGYTGGNAAYNFCNSGVFGGGAYAYSYSAGGGSGGPSGCATGASTLPNGLPVVNGTCAGWPKPSWQTGFVGIQNDGVRDLPDVSLFASNAVWNAYYVFCWSDTSQKAVGCSGAPSNWDGAGGTSFSTPIWAGIQALINKAAGGRQGLPNYRIYQLAAQEYGASGSSACNSSSGNAVAAACIFYDVTVDGIVVPCAPWYGLNGANYYDCYDPGGANGAIAGVLSTSNATYAPAYAAATGWDFATGIGTVNVANLVARWSGTARTAAHDVNGDGKSDIAWRQSGGALAAWLMNGAQVLQSGSVGSVPAVWSIVGQRDFNGDGQADWLWRDTSGNMALWFMNGLQVSGSVSLGNVPTTWSIVGTGDFNGDGYGDILWRDNSGNMAIWLMNGTTIIQSGSLGNVPTNWVVAGVGDFNGDGKADLLWRDPTAGSVATWLMNGISVAQSGSLGTVASNWTIVGTGDFNGDGKADILWRDPNAGSVAIWLMNGIAVSQSASLGTVPTVWSVAETGDFNGDGMSDVLWRDTSGDVALWFMNGLQVSASASAGNVTTDWAIQGTNAD